MARGGRTFRVYYGQQTPLPVIMGGNGVCAVVVPQKLKSSVLSGSGSIRLAFDVDLLKGNYVSHAYGDIVAGMTVTMRELTRTMVDPNPIVFGFAATANGVCVSYLSGSDVVLTAEMVSAGEYLLKFAKADSSENIVAYADGDLAMLGYADSAVIFNTEARGMMEKPGDLNGHTMSIEICEPSVRVLFINTLGHLDDDTLADIDEFTLDRFYYAEEIL